MMKTNLVQDLHGTVLYLYFEYIQGHNLSASFKDLIIKMLSYDPEHRPSIDDMRNHSWMLDNFDQNLGINHPQRSNYEH